MLAETAPARTILPLPRELKRKSVRTRPLKTPFPLGRRGILRVLAAARLLTGKIRVVRPLLLHNEPRDSATSLVHNGPRDLCCTTSLVMLTRAR
jgi:hypothetical protein